MGLPPPEGGYFCPDCAVQARVESWRTKAQLDAAHAKVHKELTRPLSAADVMTGAEVADLLRVPKSTVEEWARRDVIPSRKIGRRRLYLRPIIEQRLLDDSG